MWRERQEKQNGLFGNFLNTAWKGIIGFSTAPLAMVSMLGVGVCGIAFLFLIFILIRTVCFGDPVAGWPSMTCIILMLGGIQLLCLGILGMYLSKTYLETQYVDYFAYYRDVLLGKAKLSYSFSKSAGGSLVALFGYYLGCPLNLFVVFFEKEQIPLFLFWLTAGKLGLSGITFSAFVRKRFLGISRETVCMLSVAYGLMQYNIIQLSNIMWLDGVILLPLLLLAVYEFIQKNSKSGLFFAVFFSIIINWYTGYMIGLFSVCYYFYERILTFHQMTKKEWSRFILDTVKCGATMLSGLLASCILFYPIFLGLKKGKTAFNPEIFQFATYDSLVDVLQGFALGSIVPTVSLYCGILFFGFFVYFFITKAINKKEKVLASLAVGFMFISCWLIPLDCIWSGMRYAGTYRFRYSFMVTFLVLYLGCWGIQIYQQKKNNRTMSLVFVAGIFMILFFKKKNGYYENQNFYATIVFLAVYGILFWFLGKKKILERILPSVLAVELVLNGVFTFVINYGTNSDISSYKDYVTQSQQQIELIREREKDVFYRMDTLEKRNDMGDGCSAFINEAMVYGYRGLAHYSSTYDKDISKMIFDIGYSSLLDLSVIQESILPSDAFFGVKYLLSKKDIVGYEKVDELSGYNGKSVYLNPYALGAGIGTGKEILENIENTDPFSFQNNLFSNLLGRKIEIFKKIEPITKIENGQVEFWIPQGKTKDILYGYVDSWITELQLFIDGNYRCNYATWLSEKVFSVGYGSQEHTITLTNYTGTEQEIFPYFYFLDMDVFRSVIQELKDKEMYTEVFEDGYIKGNYESDRNRYLVLSVPYDEGWDASVNGKKVEVQRGANAFSVIPVSAGTNEIELRYHVPGVKTGLVLSTIGVFMFFGMCLIEKFYYRQGRRKNE